MDFPLLPKLLHEPQELLSQVIGIGENIEDIYPAVPMQEGMIFHTLYAPDSEQYFEQLSWTVIGYFNKLSFKRSWERVIQRYAILRTGFIWEDFPNPQQIVLQNFVLPFKELDWIYNNSSHLREDKSTLSKFLQFDRKYGFQLNQVPLIRFSIIVLDLNSVHIVWSHHHLLSDGWSSPLIQRDANMFYEAERRSIGLQLEPIAYTFKQYVIWLHHQDLAEAENFWRRMLKGFSKPTPLPKKTRQLDDNTNTMTMMTIVSPVIRKTINSFIRRYQLTANTLIQSLWSIVLNTFSGESDVLFGCTVSGRSSGVIGIESMVGIFINALPVRISVSIQYLLIEWLKEIQWKQIEVRQYEFTPLVQIQSWSEVPRGMSLFDTLVVFENYPIGKVTGRTESGRYTTIRSK